jgi:hypothetical protein
LSDEVKAEPKKKIFELINEQLFDKLRARSLPDGSVALSDPDTGKDMVILHRFRPKHEVVELLFDEVTVGDQKIFFDKEAYLQHRNSKGIYYSPQWADLFCEQVYLGENLTDICEKPNMPNYQTVCQWRKIYPEFEKKFQAAYEARGERSRDDVHRANKRMYEEQDPEKYMVDKAYIENLKWLASKDDPKKYSAHVEVHNNQAPVILRLETGVRINQELPESVREVKELTGENVKDVIEKLETADGNS